MDQLVLVEDASPVNKGLGATLFNQNKKQLLVQFFSFKLKEHQINWYQCELEAFAIAAGVNHFSPYAQESIYPMQVLTGSKPCVKAYQCLCQGQISASARLSTFLTTLSSHNITVCHRTGSGKPDK